MENLVYLYDGSFNGFMCSIFEAYEKKEVPVEICTEDGLQISFGQRTRRIFTDESKAKRVAEGIKRKTGTEALENIEMVFASNEVGKEMIAYRYIRLGLSKGRQIYNMLAFPEVLAVSNICFAVTRETHHLLGFVRFSLMENGIFFSKISPKSNIVSLIMPHFVDRYSVQPFVIYDSKHNTAGIYDLKSWKVVETQGIEMPDLADGEASWIELWRKFCGSITIKERTNLKLQRNFCPKRFWENMPEMNEVVYKENQDFVNLETLHLKDGLKNRMMA